MYRLGLILSSSRYTLHGGRSLWLRFLRRSTGSLARLLQTQSKRPRPTRPLAALRSLVRSRVAPLFLLLPASCYLLPVVCFLSLPSLSIVHCQLLPPLSPSPWSLSPGPFFLLPASCYLLPFPSLIVHCPLPSSLPGLLQKPTDYLLLVHR